MHTPHLSPRKKALDMNARVPGRDTIGVMATNIKRKKRKDDDCFMFDIWVRLRLYDCRDSEREEMFRL